MCHRRAGTSPLDYRTACSDTHWCVVPAAGQSAWPGQLGILHPLCPCSWLLSLRLQPNMTQTSQGMNFLHVLHVQRNAQASCASWKAAWPAVGFPALSAHSAGCCLCACSIRSGTNKFSRGLAPNPRVAGPLTTFTHQSFGNSSNTQAKRSLSMRASRIWRQI